MAFIFDDDINYIFTFCKSCWDFSKFIFEIPLDFDYEEQREGLCTICNNKQRISLIDSKEYYEKLNEDNV